MAKVFTIKAEFLISAESESEANVIVDKVLLAFNDNRDARFDPNQFIGAYTVPINYDN